VGTGAFRDGLYDIAEKQFSNFVKIYPRHDKVLDIYYLLGRTFLIKGRLKEAIAVFSRIINEGKNFENIDSVFLTMAELEMRLGISVLPINKLSASDFFTSGPLWATRSSRG
jgi:tetratricopeptide (TPR) repeat protein